MAALTQELAFRGYAPFTLTDGIGFWPTALLTSAACGAAILKTLATFGPAFSRYSFRHVSMLNVTANGKSVFAVGLHSAWISVKLSSTWMWLLPL